MEDSFITFQTFSDMALANDVAQQLKAGQIEFRITRIKPLLDKVYIGTAIEVDIHLKLLPKDFQKAHDLLDEYYGTLADKIEEDYFLFDFSDTELLEVIAKQDEWGHLNFHLAKKILKERGLDVDIAVPEIKNRRMKELAEPEKASTFLIVLAYLFLPIVPIEFLSGKIIVGLALPLVSFLIGSFLYYNKRILMDGVVMHSFRAEDRVKGFWIMIVSGSIFLLGVLFAIFIRTLFI